MSRFCCRRKASNDVTGPSLITRLHGFAVGTARLVLLLCLVFVPTAHAATGLEYLANQQITDGSYTNPAALATPFQSTAETLRAFHALGATTQAGIPSARQFIAAETFHNTE